MRVFVRLRRSSPLRGLGIAATLTFVAQCGDDQVTPVQPPVVQDGLHGALQKGPFLGGTRVTIQELDTALVPTGATYETVTHNDRGEYVLESNVRSTFVEVIATGTYFDEVRGDLAQTPLTLRALADVTKEAQVNVNLLTTLERDRLRQLVREQDYSFAAAEAQAQREILELVGAAPVALVPADDLDATGPGEAHAIFLAAALDLQGTLSGSSLAQWLSRLSAALVAGSAHEDAGIAAQLLQNATALRLDGVRNALQQRYAETGANVQLPPFETYAKRIVPLAVVGRFPADGAERVAFTSSIQVSFNQEVRPETLTPEAFGVESDAGPVVGMVAYSPIDWVASFVPEVPLAPSTEFRVRVSPEVMSLSGRPLDEASSWKFRTERLDLASDLVAHYPFDGDGSDVSGHGHHAQALYTTPAADRHGVEGGALGLYVTFAYPLTGAMILMPQPFPFKAQPWTYSIWFKMNKDPEVRTWAFLLAGSDARLVGEKPLVVDPTTRALFSQLEEYGRMESGVVIEDDTWYHTILMQAQNRIKIYVNGVKRLDRAQTFTSASPDTTAWAIGKGAVDAPAYGALQGVVDDVRIYARELNEVEIRALFFEAAP